MGPMVILVIVLAALVTATASAGWGQWLAHRRRVAAMDVLKAAISAGREPPREVLDEITRAGQCRAPWTEVVVFTALAFGFWVAAARSGDEASQTAFLTVAATMTVSAIGCALLAVLGPRGGPSKPRDVGE